MKHNYRPNSYKLNAKSRHNGRSLFFIAAAAMAVLCGGGVVAARGEFSGNFPVMNFIATRASSSAVSVAATEASTSLVDNSALDDSLSQLIDSDTGDVVGVSILDVASGKQRSYGDAGAMTAASTSKVLTAALTMHLVDEGALGVDEVINDQTIGELLHQMLNQSDNGAWQALNDYLGADALQQFATDIGLSSYDVYENTISAADEAKLLYEIYTFKIVNSESSQTILTEMVNTNNENLIPAVLPGEARVWHKYGEYGASLNDASVITYRGKTYVLTIYTQANEETDYIYQTDMIHQITSDVIKYW